MKQYVIAALTVLLFSAPAGADLDRFYCALGTTFGASTNTSCNSLPRGKTSSVKAYGAWLNLTNRVSAPSCIAASIAGRVNSLGNESNVELRLQIGASCTAGEKRITMYRPSLTGTDSDSFLITVVP
jgi:hypothetical protein